MLQKLYQVDQYHFEIIWLDGKLQRYRLSSLQKRCPCSKCLKGNKVEENVLAKKIKSVGNYAIAIEFTSGCSRGIYPLTLLKTMEGI